MFKLKRTLISGLLLSIVAYEPLLAYWVDNGIPICTSVNRQVSPQIIPDGVGGVIIAWLDERDGHYDIYAQRIDQNGNLIWPAGGVVVCSAQGDQIDPKITSDGDQGAIIVWYDCRDAGWGDIYAQRIDKNGIVKWESNGVPICTKSYAQYQHQIISNDLGNAIIVWSDERNEWIDADIYLQIIDINGSIKLVEDGEPICTAGLMQCFPQIASDGDNGAIIVWEDYRSPIDIYAQRINSNGVIQWASNGISICSESGDQYSPQISSDDNGNAIITWIDGRGSDSDIYAQRVDGDGIRSWISNGIPVCVSQGHQIAPQISQDMSGGAIIVWQHCDIGDTLVYAQRIEDSGNALWASNGINISQSFEVAKTPNIITNQLSEAIITWFGNNGEDYNIYAQKIFPNGDFAWGFEGITVCDATNTQYNLTICADNDDGAFITWQDYRSDNGDIYMQRIRASGYIYPECSINNDIVEFIPGDGGITNAVQSLNLPDGNATPLGYEGELTILFPCAIIDGDGDDMMVFENGTSNGGTNENYRVEVSEDGLYFVFLGECSGDDMAFDLSSTGLDRVRFVKVIDLPPDESGIPPNVGADIDAVVALNTGSILQDEPTGNIRGSITDSNQRPLDGISVIITEPSYIKTSVYSENGNYILPYLPADTYDIMFIDPNCVYSSLELQDINVSQFQSTILNVQLEHVDLNLEVTQYYFEDVDDVISMGDHVKLHLEILNKGGFLEEGNLIITGTNEVLDYPNLYFLDETDGNWKNHVSFLVNNWRPLQKLPKEIDAYITVVDPDNLDSDKVIPSETQFQVNWDAKIIKNGQEDRFFLDIEELVFDANPYFPDEDYGDLRDWDCLRATWKSTEIRRYAQYAASNKDMTNMNEDPDARMQAAKNIHSILSLKNEYGERVEFKYCDWYQSKRVSDLVLITRRGECFGDCVQFTDLSTSLLRAIGIETRDIYGLLTKRDGSGCEAHMWNEFYGQSIPGGDYEWVQYDAGIREFNNTAAYQELDDHSGVEYAIGDKNPLSYPGDLIAPPLWPVCIRNCLDLEKKLWCFPCLLKVLGTIWAGCFENRLDYYTNESVLTNNLYLDFSYFDSVEVEIVAPAKAIVSEPFQAKIIFRNYATVPFPVSLARLSTKKWALDNYDTYNVTPDSVQIPELQPGQEDTVEFIVTPLLSRDLTNLTVNIFDETQNYLTGAAFSQRIFDDNASLSLIINNVNCPTTIQPAESLIVQVEVLDDSLATVSSASVYAEIISIVDTLFYDYFPLDYSPSDSAYIGGCYIPYTAPVGLYRLSISADYPSLYPDTLIEYFEVASILDLSIDCPDTALATDTIEVAVFVLDRLDTLGKANVNLTLSNNVTDIIDIPMQPGPDNSYFYSFVPQYYDHFWQKESFNAGPWGAKVTAFYGGSVATDSTSIEILSPDLAVDSLSISYYPMNPKDSELLTIGITVTNYGTCKSDSCYLDIYETLGDSLEPIVGGVSVPEINSGESVRLITYKNTEGWIGIHVLYISIDERHIINDSNRSNNVFQSSITVIDHITGIQDDESVPRVHNKELRQNYPNPFNPVTTIEFEIDERQPVVLEIFDVSGALVRRLIKRTLEPGLYKVAWNGENERGVKVSSGIYFCRIKTPRWESHRKMVLLR